MARRACALGIWILWMIDLCDCRQILDPRILSGYCNNTVQGPHLLADSRGYVCSIRTIDFERGCCPENEQQFSCSSCNLTSQCCSTFEYCVSCCLDPARTPQHVALASKPARQLTAVNYESVFDYCRGRCRHNSASVIHENAYATENHHCFSSRERSSDGNEPSLSDGDTDFSIHIARQGQSCDAACRENGLSCKQSRLQLLNKCSVLQKHFKCRVACVSGSGADLPSEVSGSSPRHLHPGACIFSTKTSSLSCQAANRYTRRLCPCG